MDEDKQCTPGCERCRLDALTRRVRDAVAAEMGEPPYPCEDRNCLVAALALTEVVAWYLRRIGVEFDGIEEVVDTFEDAYGQALVAER